MEVPPEAMVGAVNTVGAEAVAAEAGCAVAVGTEAGGAEAGAAGAWGPEPSEAAPNPGVSIVC